MKLSAIALCVPMLAFGSMANAAPDFDQVHEILSNNACLSCHKVDGKLVGPAYEKVAEKHKGQDDAAEILTKHIKEGSSGVYGSIPMPPNTGISDDDIKVVVDWLIAGAPH